MHYIDLISTNSQSLVNFKDSNPYLIAETVRNPLPFLSYFLIQLVTCHEFSSYLLLGLCTNFVWRLHLLILLIMFNIHLCKADLDFICIPPSPSPSNSDICCVEFHHSSEWVGILRISTDYHYEGVCSNVISVSNFPKKTLCNT